MKIVAKSAPADKTDTQLQEVFTAPEPGAWILRDDWGVNGEVMVTWVVPDEAV